MKDIFKKYPMQEGESMGKWQRRVSRQIYEEQYADKTPEQMQKILEKYQKEHPDEFEGNNARLISPAFSALFDRLRELNMENAIFENKPKSIFRRLPEQSKEKVKTPKEILDDVSINTYMREININILAPSYKFILSARQEGNEEFLKDAREAISNNLGKRGPGRFYIRNGFYNVEVYDTPEVRKALEAVFEKHGLDTSLLKQQEATNGRRPANAGIKKQPNPTVVKVPEAKTTSYFTEEVKKFNLAESALAREPLPKHVEKTTDGKLKIGEGFGWRARTTIRILFEYATKLGLSAQKHADEEKTPESYRLILDNTPANRAFINACVRKEVNQYVEMDRSPHEVLNALKRSAPNSVVSHLKKNKDLIDQNLPAGVIAADGIIFIGSKLGNKAQEIVRALYERGDEIGLDITKNCDTKKTPESYKMFLGDTPENRAFINANMTRDGQNLISSEEAMKKMLSVSSNDAGIKKQPNPTVVRKAQQSEIGQTEGGVSNKTCNIEGFSFEQTKDRLRMMFVKSEESVQFYKKLKESILKQCEGVKPGRLCFKDRTGGMALFTVPNSPEVREAMKVVYEEYGLDISVLKQSEIKKAVKTSKQSEEGGPSKTDKGQPKKEEPAKITTVLSQYGTAFSFGNNVKTNSDGTTFTVDMRKKTSKTIGTGTMSMDQLIKYTKGKGAR